MRVAVIGCGSIGRRHIGNLLSLGCDVDAYDVSRDALQAVKRQSPAARVVCDDKVGAADAVVIATPAAAHKDSVWAATVSNTPMFVEKPIGTLVQLETWRQWANTGVITQVGYNWRFHPQMLEWRSRVSKRDSTCALILQCDTDMALWPGASYDDPLLECSHEIDTALWCGAGPLLIARYLMDEPGCHLNFEGCSVALHWARANARRYYKLYRPCRDFLEKKHCSNCGGHECLHLEMKTPSVTLDLSYRKEMEHFLDCVRQKKATAVPLSEGLKVLEVVAQVEQMTKANA